jgi:uncharacterized protein (UPF0218 family)
MVKYKLTLHNPTPQEIETTQRRYEAFKQFRQEFKKKYGLLAKDEIRVRKYNESHRDMVLIGDIEGPDSLRVAAMKEWAIIKKLSEQVWPEFDVVVVADYE